MDFKNKIFINKLTAYKLFDGLGWKDKRIEIFISHGITVHTENFMPENLFVLYDSDGKTHWFNIDKGD